MRLLLTSVAAVALVAGHAATALAHGGAYRGPGDEVPEGSREPSDPPPPPEPRPPGTPTGDNPGGPVTPPGDNPGGPKTGEEGGGGPKDGGNPPPTPTGGPAGGPTSGPGGPGRRAARPGDADWTLWWDYNKDSLRDRRARRRAKARPATGQGAHAFGNGTASSAQPTPVTDGFVANRIVPALESLVSAPAGTLDGDIRSAAALALAKIGAPGAAVRLQALASARKGDGYDKIVVESAALGLGILQPRDGLPELRSFLATLASEPAQDGGSLFARPFAAVSLGLLGTAGDRERIVPAALTGIVNGKESGKDVKPAAILALGLLGDAANAEVLLEMARTGRSPDGKEALTDTEVAHAVSSLGRIGVAGLPGAGQESAVADYVTSLLTVKAVRTKAAVNTTRSAAIALGQIGAASQDAKLQRRILGTLKSVIVDADDAQERHFAIMSVGRVGAAPGVEAALREECLDVLRHHLDKGRNLTPTFAALGIGVLAKSGAGADDEKVCKPLRERFAAERNAQSRGAYAVALGLVRDPAAVPMLRDAMLDKGNEPKLRGYAALAIGMIEPKGDGVRADLRTVLTTEDRREIRVQAAIAAGLLADRPTVQVLVDLLDDRTQSQYVLGSVALALGQSGAEEAVEPLIRIATDGAKYPDLTRALAVVALGQIGDRSDVPVLSRISTDVNYRDQPSYEVELLSIL